MPRLYKGEANPNWAGGKVLLACAVCAKDFMVIPSRANVAKYCSLRCAGKVGSDKVRGRGIVEKKCGRCGEMFTSRAWSRKRFCSRQCMFAWRSEYFSGPGNPNWLDGIGTGKYPNEFRVIRKKIIERDGRRCMNPTCTTPHLVLTVHHINYDKMNCSDRNLITLCSGCNSKANYDRERWEVLYVVMMYLPEEQKRLCFMYPKVPGKRREIEIYPSVEIYAECGSPFGPR